MADILSHPRVYSFLHIPVQSGSDNVLSDMKREYTSEDFITLVDFLKQRYYYQYLFRVDVIPSFLPQSAWYKCGN